MIGKAVALFPEMESVGERSWGTENLLVLASGKYTLKKLAIRAGNKGGLQYHRFKDEAGYVIKGSLEVTFENPEGMLESKLLSEGDWFHFPSGSVHQEKAVTDVEILEVSTPHFNDRVRVEKQFGLDDSSGLPTTLIDDVIEG